MPVLTGAILFTPTHSAALLFKTISTVMPVRETALPTVRKNEEAKYINVVCSTGQISKLEDNSLIHILNNSCCVLTFCSRSVDQNCL